MKRDTELRRTHADRRGPDGRVPPGWQPKERVLAAICRTKGCAVEGRAFTVAVTENGDGIDRVLCGRCKEWIEDLAEGAAPEVARPAPTPRRAIVSPPSVSHPLPSASAAWQTKRMARDDENGMNAGS